MTSPFLFFRRPRLSVSGRLRTIPALFLFSLLLTCAVASTLCACTSCGSGKESERTKGYSSARKEMEKEADGRLALARRQLAAGDYAGARQTIGQMRKDCYLALDARTQGIVVMDSVDLMEACAALARTDSLLRVQPDSARQTEFEELCRKVQFYERKIRHDLQSQTTDTTPSKK